MLKAGLTGEASMKVAAGNTAIEVGSGSVPVFATPMLVALMENAAINAVQGDLPPGQTTVGIKVDIAHTAATPIGKTVTARAELTVVDGRRLIFAVSAVDESGSVGHGTHERFTVDLEKFLAKVKAKQS
jgi:fluoroacetyl-CoA thioesterase